MMSFLRLCKVIIQLRKFLYACVISAAFAGCYLSNKTPNQKIKGLPCYKEDLLILLQIILVYVPFDMVK